MPSPAEEKAQLVKKLREIYYSDPAKVDWVVGEQADKAKLDTQEPFRRLADFVLLATQEATEKAAKIAEGFSYEGVDSHIDEHPDYERQMLTQQANEIAQKIREGK